MNKSTNELLFSLFRIIGSALYNGWKNVRSGKWQIHIVNGYFIIEDRAKTPDFLVKIKLSTLSSGVRNTLYRVLDSYESRPQLVNEETRPQKKKHPEHKPRKKQIDNKISK